MSCIIIIYYSESLYVVQTTHAFPTSHCRGCDNGSVHFQTNDLSLDQVLQIDWRPLVRDSVFYGGSVMIFILFSWDGQFVWWESLLLLLLYVAYIITMKFNQRLLKFLDNPTCSW